MATKKKKEYEEVLERIQKGIGERVRENLNSLVLEKVQNKEESNQVLTRPDTQFKTSKEAKKELKKSDKEKALAMLDFRQGGISGTNNLRSALEKNEKLTKEYNELKDYEEAIINKNLSKTSKENLDRINKGANVSDNNLEALFEYSNALRNERKSTGKNISEIKEAAAARKRVTNAEEMEKKVKDATEFAKEHEVLASLISVPQNIVGGVTGTAESISQFILDPHRRADVNEAAYTGRRKAAAARDQVASELGNVGGFLYKLGMSGVDSVATMGIGGAVNAAKIGQLAKLDEIVNLGKTTSLGLMSTQSGTDTFIDLTQKGASIQQAASGGLAAGFFEAMFESVPLNKLSNLLKKGTLKSATKEMADQVFTNATEEAATEFANIAYDTLANGELSNYEIRKKELIRAGKSEEEADSQIKKEVLKQIGEAWLGGGLMGGAFGAGGIAINKLSNTPNSKEQTVIDAETKKRTEAKQKERAQKSRIDEIMAEQKELFVNLNKSEQEGIKEQVLMEMEEGKIDYSKITLTSKEKREIERQLKEEIENGELSIELIEETILPDETAELRQLKEKFNNDLTEEERQNIAGRIKEVKSVIAQRMQGAFPADSKLQEIYAQERLRAETFTRAEKETDTEITKNLYKSAIQAGFNNTRKSHSLFEITNKIANDRGTDYGFVNNEQLKTLKYDVENRIINGLVRTKEDGKVKVLINIDSPMALNQIIGHETTHLLEGTELHSKLKQIVKDYASTKGIYEGKYKAISELYKDTNADIENEVTADLIGEYLFTDEQFVKGLSAKEPNIFRKIYEYIKHVAKMATAGSKEARELEKVKRSFDKAYKEVYKATKQGKETNLAAKGEGSVKYLISPKYEADFDNWFKSTSPEQRRKDGGRIKIGTTPEILLPLDIKKGDFVMGKSKIQKILDKHSEMTPELIKSVPYMVENPIAIIQSLTKKNSIIAYGNLLTAEGKPVMAALKFEEQRNGEKITDLSIITSAYTRREGGDQYQFDNGHILYLNPDKKITDSWLKSLGLQLPSDITNYGYIDKIAKFHTSVNTQSTNMAEAFKKAQDLVYEKESETKSNAENSKKYSLSDSTGRQLTKEQAERFKDSKVRDENGSLMVMYHGTPSGGYTVFKDGTYFTSNKEYADRYQNPSASSISTGKVADNPQTYEVYLDIKKPFDISDPEAREIYINDYIKGGNAMGINPYESDTFYSKINTIDWTEGEDLRDFLIENKYDYDGLVLDEGADGGYGGEVAYRGKSYVVFSPEQIKSVDNTNPTEDPDIRFSLSAPVEETKDLVALERHNVPYIEYDGSTEDRLAKINGEADIRNAKSSLSNPNGDIAPTRGWNVYGRDLLRRKDIAPIREDVGSAIEDIAPIRDDIALIRTRTAPEDIAPIREGAAPAEETAQELAEADLPRKTRKELRRALIEIGKDDIDKAMANAKDLSKLSMNNMDTIRVTERVFGREAGQKLNNLIFQKAIDNEADSIKWQNQERNEIKTFGIKAKTKESAAVQKWGEGKYLNDEGDYVVYDDQSLAREFPDIKDQDKIKYAAKEIKKKYDNYLELANNVLTDLGFEPIPKRDDYMRHFQELTDVFSRNGIPFNAQNMQEHVLPTDINGLTEFWSPQKNYFSSAQPRKGLRTTLDAIAGVDGYISGIANLIYHTEDIQRGRAFEEYVREIYGEKSGFDKLEGLSEQEQKKRIKQIQDNHLSAYAAWIHEWTNNLAGKKNKLDRAIEETFGRKGFAFLDEMRKQTSATMIGYNVSSSLTNLIAPVQAMAKTNKAAVFKGTADSIKNIFIRDNFESKNRFLISRMGTDAISQTRWEKVRNTGFLFMKGIDWFASNQIVRSKYYELRSKGLTEDQAHAQAGQFAARIMGDRTKGATPQLYNSKLFNMVAQFQLEVNNQLYSMFYDTYHESKEAAQKSAFKTTAKMTFTLGQLFALTHVFGKTFEALAGYNPTFDVIEILMTALGAGDDDDDKSTSERLKEAADMLVDALPYVNLFTDGGRIPMSSAVPNLVGVMTGGEDQYGNELTLSGEVKKVIPFLAPVGGNQIKKTINGLKMFDDNLPVTGSYTDSGNLRFPVEDTIKNRVQAGIFGQWANKNAREYFDNERKPLKEKQIEEYEELDLPISDYWKYREELAKKKKTADKIDYIASLDLPVSKKNIMANNVANNEEKLDLTDYKDYGSFEEFHYAVKNPDNYLIAKATGGYSNYKRYSQVLSNMKADKDENGKTISGSKKEKVVNYINSSDMDYGAKLIMYKSQYPSDDTYNYEIIDYLNDSRDFSCSDIKTILRKLGFTVDSNGNISWN